MARPLCYQGDRRCGRAHVIVRREHVGRASNGIGFRHHEDGRFLAVISDHDRTKHDETWLGCVTRPARPPPDR